MRSVSVTPKTARTITSKVSARIRSRMTERAALPPASDVGRGDIAGIGVRKFWMADP